MIPLLKSAVCGLSSTSRAVGCGGVLQNYATMLTSGLKTYSPLPDYSDVVIPERTKLKFMDKVPTLKKVRREMKRLKDIVGPEQRENSFTSGQYGIVAMGGGYLHWGHMEMMRLTINRRIDPRITYALWRINAPYKPITSKGLGKRMGGGKGAVDHYVTPIRCGRLLVELGGRCELGEVKGLLTEVAKKLPFPAKVVSRESLAQMQQAAATRELNNQNPWTFSRIAVANMLGIRKVLSPVDLRHHGRYTGKFHLPERV